MNWRKILFRLHGWLGLNTGLLLFVVCFSGSFATLSHEIDWLLNPTMRVETRNAPYDWSAMYKTLSDEFPEERVAGIYAPVGNGFAALAYVAFTNGQTRKVYLDPYTGVLKGHTSFFNVQRFFSLLSPAFFRRHARHCPRHAHRIYIARIESIGILFLQRLAQTIVLTTRR